MPLPGNISLVTVTGQFLTYTGAACTGTVKFRASGDPWLKDASADATLVPGDIVCTLDADGKLVGPTGAVGAGGLGVKLPATDDPDLAPTGFVYDVTVAVSGQPEQEYSVSLPALTATVDLADLAPVTPVTGGGVPVVTSVDGVTPDITGAVDLDAVRQKAPVTLTDAATITTDASVANVFRVTLAGNRTLANPTNPVDGQRLTWEFTQDATGGRTITLGNAFVFGADLPAVTLSTAPAATDVLGAQYHAASGKWRVLALAKGF
ncbi:hypothetical protein [Saccharothrix stipae]